MFTHKNDVFVTFHNESVKDDSHALISPGADELLSLVKAVGGGQAQTTGDPGQVSQVEDVVKLGGCGWQLRNNVPGKQHYKPIHLDLFKNTVNVVFLLDK